MHVNENILYFKLFDLHLYVGTDKKMGGKNHNLS